MRSRAASGRPGGGIVQNDVLQIVLGLLAQQPLAVAHQPAHDLPAQAVGVLFPRSFRSARPLAFPVAPAMVISSFGCALMCTVGALHVRDRSA